MAYTTEQLITAVEQWLTTGELNVKILSQEFSFISPYWKSSNTQEFIDKFTKSTIYQDTALKNINKFDPIIKLTSSDGKHFAIVLQYHTKNGSSVYETVLGTVSNGLISELRSIYDLAETKHAHQLSN